MDDRASEGSIYSTVPASVEGQRREADGRQDPRITNFKDERTSEVTRYNLLYFINEETKSQTC